MTKEDYMNVVYYALDIVESRERQLCRDYCELNPQDRERRERDRDLFLLALMHARYEIERQCKVN